MCDVCSIRHNTPCVKVVSAAPNVRSEIVDAVMTSSEIVDAVMSSESVDAVMKSVQSGHF